jgi:hypothetical protein
MLSSSAKRSSSEAIKVVVRIRPLSAKEIEDCRKVYVSQFDFVVQ